MHLDFIDHSMPSDRNKEHKIPYSSVYSEINKEHKFQSSEPDIGDSQDQPIMLNTKMSQVRALKPVAKVIIENPAKPRSSENARNSDPKLKNKWEVHRSKEVRISTKVFYMFYCTSEHCCSFVEVVSPASLLVQLMLLILLDSL